MKRIALLIIVLTLHYTVFSYMMKVQAAEYATCDACGYCPIDLNANPGDPNGERLPPQSWNKCVQCLYIDEKAVIQGVDYPLKQSALQKNIGATYLDNPKVTLELDEAGNPPPTAPGKYYSTLTGCIDMRGIDKNNKLIFSQTTAIGAVSQTGFNLIFNMIKALSLIGLLWGAYAIGTASGEPGRLERGRSILYASLAGLLVATASTFILDIIINTLLKGIVGN